jgi:hypothetical protein
MFCPQCGQQQVSNEVRFCSRCGFQLGGVTGLLANNGAFPAGIMQGDAAQQTKTVSPRRKGARQGGQLLLFGIFLMPVLAIMHELLHTPEELPLVGLIVFFGGLLRLVFALIFEDGPLRQPKPQPYFQYAPPFAANQMPPRGTSHELPPAQAQPARSYVPPRTDTADMSYRPPSVTEGTTRLLDDEKDTSAR